MEKRQKHAEDEDGENDQTVTSNAAEHLQQTALHQCQNFTAEGFIG
jgi:hypothetical protein